MSDEMHLDAQARADLYHFLSATYLGPMQPDALRQITDSGVLRDIGMALGEEAVKELKDFAAAEGKVNDPEGLKQEYMDLFAAPTGRYVIPFEDVYRGATSTEVRGPLLGEWAIAVKRLYQAAGAEMEGHCKELPTHIGVELGFMSFLCSKEAAVSGEDPGGGEAVAPSTCTLYRELQARFLVQHLNVWFPLLSRAIHANSVSGFYRGLASLAEALITRDTAQLAAITHTAKTHFRHYQKNSPKNDAALEACRAG